MIKMIIAMIMVRITALKKPKRNILQGHSKGIHFFIFNLKTPRLSSCLNSNGTKSQIFGPRKDSDSVQW